VRYIVCYKNLGETMTIEEIWVNNRYSTTTTSEKNLETLNIS